MLATDDWHVVSVEEASEDEWYDQVVEAEYELSPEEREYLGSSDQVLISARSTLARNLTDIRPKRGEPITSQEDTLQGDFVVKNYHTPIEIEEGDDVLRLVAYEEEDRVTGDELDSYLEDSPGETHADSWVMGLDRPVSVSEDRSDPLNLRELEEDKNRYLEPGEALDRNADYTDSKVQLYQTREISMPDDIWGIIRSVRNSGYGYPFWSPAIDPGFEGRLFIEVDGVEEERPLSWPEDGEVSIEIFRDTPVETLSGAASGGPALETITF